MTTAQLQAFIESAMPANVSNGSSIQGQRRALAIHYLAQGFTPYYVANRVNCSQATAKALRDAEFETIESRKPILKSINERNALLSLLELGHRLETEPGKLSATELNMVAGTAIDKAVVLGGDPSFTMRVEHYHRVSDDDLYGFAIARSKQANARTLDQPDAIPALPNGDSLTSGDNAHSTHDASNGQRKRRPKGKRYRKRANP